MPSTALPEPEPTPDSAISVAGRAVPGAIDPEDPEAVPGALTALVAAARRAHAAIDVNGYYPAKFAVGAIEDVVAVLVRIATNVGPYVDDCSSKGGTAMVRAEARLTEARTELSDARHHLLLDEDSAMQTATSAEELTSSAT